MKLYIIADTDVLSAFAAAEKAPGFQSRIEHLSKLYGEILVPSDVRKELINPKGSNEAAKEFGRTLGPGFVERDPKVVDHELSERFVVKDIDVQTKEEGPELGDVHCIALAEELAREENASVLVLSSDGAVKQTIKERAAEQNLRIKVANTRDILADSAKHLFINDLKAEASRFHDNGLYRFSRENLKDTEKLHELLQKQRQEQAQAQKQSL